MTIALIITFVYGLSIYLIFFRFQLLKFTIVWGVVSFWIGFHLLLIFLIGLRFFTPYSIDGHMIRQTVQLSTGLPEPTELREVLVTQNTPVKKGDILYRFDDTLFRAKLKEQQAQLAEARQNALILDQDVDIARDAVSEAEANEAFAQQEVTRYSNLVLQGGARQETLDKWQAQLIAAKAQVSEAQANLAKAELAREAQLDGVNAQVAAAEAAVDEAQYYLDRTVLRAPEDGTIVSQQARPGLYVGGRRIAAIAALIADADAYFLATYYQEHLKFVKPGLPVEVALDTHPGRIFTGTVVSIWEGTGQGQIKPSGDVPNFRLPSLQGRFAVEIKLDDPELASALPGGTHGAAAIYTGAGSKGFDVLRKVNIRLYSWANFLFPLDL
ncbi:multidrug resistance efflux pump [Roseibium hamelinense]|uniref:Multidrug resistance efflux pump n=1 Tax=Roseibium hamelinense TaxID=150831 RepID=A0A562SKV8_9HYPH|nr:efflux RND transporter periplasmic adaptor subunit [Roseibium hamelinense]MTI43302.1 HlyD family secretion protein [Roseibium hamelinense]TWI81768.1 multidrug resistance efflux pump [Roseibium hamelinense]